MYSNISFLCIVSAGVNLKSRVGGGGVGGGDVDAWVDDKIVLMRLVSTPSIRHFCRLGLRMGTSTLCHTLPKQHGRNV